MAEEPRKSKRGRPRLYLFKDEKRTPYHAYRVVVEAYYHNKCQYCGATENFELHHIDGNPKNDKLENLTLLCLKCNRRAEKELNIRLAQVLQHLGDGNYSSKIARIMGLSRQLVHYYARFLVEQHFIKRDSRSRIVSYSLTTKGEHYLKRFEMT